VREVMDELKGFGIAEDGTFNYKEYLDDYYK